MKTVKYHKRCFDQIEGVMAENKILIGEVDWLQLEVERASEDRATQEEQVADLSR
jgi:hypothetical protein